MDKVYVIAGPTGVGKTKYSIELAKELNGEIINGDAYQIYKDLNIGTAKITEEEKDGIIHHLFDILEFNESISVFEYQQLAREKIVEIINRGKTPIIVGGSGYYLKTILYDYQFKEIVEVDFSEFTNEELYEKLKEKYPLKAENIHVNNRKRVENALKLSDEETPIGSILYDATIYCLTMDRDKLYERINYRVDLMFEQGLLEEVEGLIAKGANFEMQAMQAIGYKEFSGYFSKEIDLDKVKELIKRNSRRYAKKQYTWFRHQMDVLWLDVDNKK